MTVYGLGDVAVQIVSFLLVPRLRPYLTPADYGVIGLLGGVEVVAKIVFRCGLDGSFMRFCYDCDDERGAAAAGEHDLLLPARGRRRRAARLLLAAAPSARRRDARQPRLHARAAAHAAQHVRDRLHVHPVPRAAHRAADARRSALLTFARSVRRSSLRLVARRRPALGRHRASYLADLLVTTAVMAGAAAAGSRR